MCPPPRPAMAVGAGRATEPEMWGAQNLDSPHAQLTRKGFTHWGTEAQVPKAMLRKRWGWEGCGSQEGEGDREIWELHHRRTMGPCFASQKYLPREGLVHSAANPLSSGGPSSGETRQTLRGTVFFS